MTRQHRTRDESRYAGWLFVATIVGLASGAFLLAAYDQMVGQPGRTRDVARQIDVYEVMLHRCAVVLNPHCIE